MQRELMTGRTRAMSARRAVARPRERQPGPATASGRAAALDQVPPRLIRFAAVRDRTGLSRSTIWRLERAGTFPKHHRISPNAVAWVEQDVSEWIRAKAHDR